MSFDLQIHEKNVTAYKNEISILQNNLISLTSADSIYETLEQIKNLEDLLKKEYLSKNTEGAGKRKEIPAVWGVRDLSSRYSSESNIWSSHTTQTNTPYSTTGYEFYDSMIMGSNKVLRPSGNTETAYNSPVDKDGLYLGVNDTFAQYYVDNNTSDNNKTLKDVRQNADVTINPVYNKWLQELQYVNNVPNSWHPFRNQSPALHYQSSTQLAYTNQFIAFFAVTNNSSKDITRKLGGIFSSSNAYASANFVTLVPDQTDDKRDLIEKYEIVVHESYTSANGKVELGESVIFPANKTVILAVTTGGYASTAYDNYGMVEIANTTLMEVGELFDDEALTFDKSILRNIASDKINKVSQIWSLH